MDSNARIFVAGHRGLVGSALTRRLKGLGYRNLVLRTHAELDLTNQAAVARFFADERPQFVFLAAARVGGIEANNRYPAQFIRDNLAIQTNVIHSAYEAGVERLLFLGSSCIYPKLAPQPIREEALLTGALEETNRPYALAKIAGIEMCWSYNRQYGTRFLAAMPTNLYGPGDNYHPENSHVVPALIRRFHEAKVAGTPTVTLWGTGTPLREFLHVDDMAAASVFVMNLPKATYDQQTQPMQSHLNVGFGSDVTIRTLAELIARVVGYGGVIDVNPAQPDGSPRKLMDSSRLNALGWRPVIGLEQGLAHAYSDFLKDYGSN
jgi:GDP-L-fucose synthase